MAFFVDHLPQGESRITYRLRAEIPGSFHALPTNAYAFYTPTFQAANPFERWKAGYATTQSIEVQTTPGRVPTEVLIELTATDTRPGGGTVIRPVSSKSFARKVGSPSTWISSYSTPRAPRKRLAASQNPHHAVVYI